MSSYSNQPAPEPAPAPAEGTPPLLQVKTKRVGVKMTDKQKTDLTKHMDKQKKAGMTGSEMKSHRMKMMGRMRKGESIGKAHKAISK
tara:strand:+ start:315 stop:575 length:261 start_codon:yes stop_codon:yes gene_type:complete